MLGLDASGGGTEPSGPLLGFSGPGLAAQYMSFVGQACRCFLWMFSYPFSATFNSMRFVLGGASGFDFISGFLGAEVMIFKSEDEIIIL